MLITIFRIICALTNPFYKTIAFFRKRKRIPSITNHILVTSATVLARRIRVGELTCQEVISVFVDRCKQVNPIVNAILQDRFDEALEDARKADDFLRSKEMSISQLEDELPLLGIPVTIKECCSVKGMMCSNGMRKNRNRIATRNGDAVQRLINAGAIPIAVTSTPPGCAYLETFNDIIGYTNNPYDTRKSSGGSSGGEAGLIASAASILGLGSDAGGSVRVPAAFCGIYGHKLTNDVTLLNGMPAYFATQWVKDMTTVGPLCRYAIDLELVTNVLSGSYSQIDKPNSQMDFRRTKVFYLFEYNRDVLLVDSVIKNKIAQAIAHFSAQRGCQVQQLVVQELENIIEITWDHFQTTTSDAFEEMSSRGNNPETLKKRIMKFIRHILTSWNVDSKFHIKQRETLQMKLLRLLEGNAVLLLPTWPDSACYKYQSILKMYNVTYTYFANAFGLPSTAVPIGFDNKGMPVSIQVIAAPTKDRLCISVAKELEKLFDGWIPPCDQRMAIVGKVARKSKN